MPLPLLRRLVLAATGLTLAACATLDEPPANALKQTLLAVTAEGELLRVAAARPQQVLERRTLRGLAAGETLVGLDFRVARGLAYALSSHGQLYTLDLADARLKPLGAPLALALQGRQFGLDFNPAADRLRVVSDQGQNLRLHPDSGALVDGDAAQPGLQGDPALHFAAGDAHAGRAPRVVAAAYTYHPRDGQLTTNYAIDAGLGALLMQGSAEGTLPVVSPNTGRLTTVGLLGTGALQDAAFDIADTDNTALAALRSAGHTRLYRIELASGRATLLGTLGGGQPLAGLAIEP